jgi:glycosyltransferase involved in cell wall biosynthesis
MPYVLNGYTQNIYPMKLHEYLASGRPVISTPIRSVQEFDQVVRLARTADEWSSAVEEALAPEARSPAAIAARQAVAQRHDWSELAHRIARVICERLNLEDGARLEKITLATPHFESPAEGGP